MAQEVSLNYIVPLASKVLTKYGLSSDDAAAVISHLLDGELSGHSSHGFYRIPGIVRVLKNKGAGSLITKERETDVSCLVNGGGRLGLVVAKYSTDLAINKALKNRIGIVGAYNYVGTTGAMGYYTRCVAENNLIGIVMCNSEYAVAPWGGKKAILGTNPISISFPSSNEPIVADLATSAWSYGDLALAMKEGRKIPEGIVIDKEGNPSTDPNDADNGCQLPMAGHKGYALGLAIELLAGPFVNAKGGREAVEGSDGFIEIVLSPDLFTSLSAFIPKVDAVVEEIKNSPKIPSSDEILLPGERSYRRRIENKDKGIIRISEAVIKDLEELAQ